MSSLASNTALAYSVSINAFDQFRVAQESGIIWPQPHEHILMLIAYLSIHGFKQT